MSRYYGMQFELEQDLSSAESEKFWTIVGRHWTLDGEDPNKMGYGYGENNLFDKSPYDVVEGIAREVRKVLGFDAEFHVIVSFLEQTPTETIEADGKYYANLLED